MMTSTPGELLSAEPNAGIGDREGHARVAFPERRGAHAHLHSATLSKLDRIAE
jgi:hypothetical protein